ncbi:MAG: Holliday junction branch migration protein RuvA [Clostridia bacterium]|nr:Holliday junction branch migration protein RuvA [Clostridia bacterium]
MFYSVRGKLIHLDASFAVIEAGGVGYKLTVSGFTRAALSQKTGEEVFLLTHLSVREDCLELFGFENEEELSVFRMLISVSGIGPKVAMSVLGSMRPEQLALAVSSEDKKTISKCPGIGPKTAARIILELKDKLRNEISDGDEDGRLTSGSPVIPSEGRNEAAVEALMVLGFPRSAAAAAVSDSDSSESLESVIKKALKKLGRI